MRQPVNEAPNSRFQVVPDLFPVRKLLLVGGVPVSRLMPTVTGITTGSSIATITFSDANDWQVGDLAVAPITMAAAAAGLNQASMEVTARTSTTATFTIPNGGYATIGTAANGVWRALVPRPRATAIATTIDTAPTITFSAPHGVRKGELVQAPVTAAATAAGLNQCWLQVNGVPAPDQITVAIPRGLGPITTSDANGSWTVMTRGDDVGLTGDFASGDDLGIYGKTSSLGVWIEDDPNLVARFPRSSRVVLAIKGSQSNEFLGYFHNILNAIDYLGTLRGVGLSVCSLSGGGTASACITDDGVVTTGSSTISSTRFWISHGRIITGSGLYFDGIQMAGQVGNAFVFSDFTRTSGSIPVDGDYVPTTGPVRPKGSITIGTMNGATITFLCTPDVNNNYSWPVSLYQESSGRLGPEIRALHWNLEGICTTWGALLATKEAIDTPITYGHVATATGYQTTPTLSRSFSAGVVTVTVVTPRPHGLINGEPIEIGGVSQAAYNGIFSTNRTGTNSFTYTFAAASDPGAPTGSPILYISHYAAARCDLNIRDGAFAIYTTTPGETWRFVSMDVSRVIA